MKPVNYREKPLVVDILAKSFQDNLSVNYIAKQDNKRLKRIKALMDYSFDMCYLFGEVFLSDDKTAAALVLYPEQKKSNLKTTLLDVKLIIKCIGIEHIKKALKREGVIKKIQPEDPEYYYLWFIGVDPAHQNNGIGSEMLDKLITQSELKNRAMYLETSTLKNLPWYKKYGFEIYEEADLGYKLYFLRRN